MIPNQSTFNIHHILEELIKVTIILTRPVVQVQILGILVSILVAWLIARWFLSQLSQYLPRLNQLERSDQTQRLTWRQYGGALVQSLSAPTLSLIFITLIKLWFEHLGWFYGYLEEGTNLLRFFWFYRFFIVSIYALFSKTSVSYYHQYFLAPLFYLMLIRETLGLFLDFDDFTQISIIKVFGQLITIGNIFVIIFGLYFWIIGVSLLERLLIYIAIRINFSDPRVTQVVALLMRYFLISVGVILIFGYVGVSSTAIAAITGGLSVGIGFGLKEVISNFVSGIWLLFEGALKPGDIIKINDKMTEVTKLGIRATTVQVLQDNSEEIIPNQTFFTQSVSTLTGSNRLFYHALIVGASYSCCPLQVIQVLSQVALAHPNILENPPPVAFALQFNDSSVDFELKFWLDDPLISKRVTSELICNIWQAFVDHNIEIPYPQQDIHIRSSILPTSGADLI